MSELIKRTYRITPLQDKIIKRTTKKLSSKENKISESSVVRSLIDGIK